MKLTLEGVIGLAAAIGLGASALTVWDVLGWSLGGACAIIAVELVDALRRRQALRR